jgi:Animal haem peroxidase
MRRAGRGLRALGVRDLPHNADGSAVVGDGRDDENQIIAQLHTAFLLAHNAFVDQGFSFAQAQRALVLYYQRAVVDDYLPHVAAPFVTSADTNADVSRLVSTGMTPIEFSVAAFRFGHSQVREAYELNEESGQIDVFNLAGNDLHGGRQIPAGRQIGWGNFFPELSDPDDADGVNISRRIDPLISRPLYQLPIPGAEAAGSNVLAFRNMIRAKFYEMPSRQTLARHMGLPLLSNSRLHLPATVAAAFNDGVPLWY